MSEADLSQQAVWSSVTRFHDWRANDFPQRLFAAAVAANVIGPPGWMKLHHAESQRPVPPLRDSNFYSFLRGCANPEDPSQSHVELGGDRPHGWSSSWTIDSWDAEENRVTGYSIVNIFFPIASAVPAGPLIQAFTTLYHPTDVEFACVHPVHEQGMLKMTEYRQPLTYGPMFAGVFWANFLGPGHIERFDAERLDFPGVAVFRKTPDTLLLIVSNSLEDAADPAFRTRLRALTGKFRAVERSR